MDDKRIDEMREVSRYLNEEKSDPKSIGVLYGESEDVTNVKTPLLLKMMLSIQSKLVIRLNSIGYQEIESSQGDFKKYKDYKIISKFVNGNRELIKGMGVESEHVKTLGSVFDILETNKREFQRAFKSSGDNIIKIFYVSLVMYLIDMSVVMAEAIMRLMKDGDSIDTYIDSVKGYKKMFASIKETIEDKDLRKLLKSKINDVTYGEANFPYHAFDNLYGEASIASNLSFMKLGMATFLYKITGVCRYIIYRWYFSKYTREKKRDIISQQLEYFNTEDTRKRVNLDNKLEKDFRDYKIDNIKSESDITKEEETDKVTVNNSEFEF